jgi:hypothetical protein
MYGKIFRVIWGADAQGLLMQPHWSENQMYKQHGGVT